MQYYKSLLAILLIAIQQRAPAQEYSPAPQTATTGKDDSHTACTVRDRVQQYIDEEGMDYHGRAFEDIYITAPALADVLGCSNQTARRRLEYFQEQGVVDWDDDSKSKHWYITDEFTAASDNKVRLQREIIDTAQAALKAAEEE